MISDLLYPWFQNETILAAHQPGTAGHWGALGCAAETAPMEKQTAAEGLLQPHPISHGSPFSKHGQMFIQGHAEILLLNFSCILFQVDSFAGTDQEKP